MMIKRQLRKEYREPKVENINVEKGLAGSEVLGEADLSIITRLTQLIKIRRGGGNPENDCVCENGILDDVALSLIGIICFVTFIVLMFCFCKKKV